MNKESKIEFTLSENFGLFREGDPIIICNNLKPKDIDNTVIPSFFFNYMKACILYVDGIYYVIKKPYIKMSLKDMIQKIGYHALTLPLIRNDIENLNYIFQEIHNDQNYERNIDDYISKIYKFTDFYRDVIFINCKLNEIKDYFPYIFKFHKEIGEKIRKYFKFIARFYCIINFNTGQIIESVNNISNSQGKEIAKELLKTKLEKISKEI